MTRIWTDDGAGDITVEEYVSGWERDLIEAGTPALARLLPCIRQAQGILAEAGAIAPHRQGKLVTYAGHTIAKYEIAKGLYERGDFDRAMDMLVNLTMTIMEAVAKQPSLRRPGCPPGSGKRQNSEEVKQTSAAVRARKDALPVAKALLAAKGESDSDGHKADYIARLGRKHAVTGLKTPRKK